MKNKKKKKGLLGVDEDDSALVSGLIGYATDSTVAGALLGGDILGAALGDLLNSGDSSGSSSSTSDSDDLGGGGSFGGGGSSDDW